VEVLSLPSDGVCPLFLPLFVLMFDAGGGSGDSFRLLADDDKTDMM
jgi:hypothetical protein